MDGPTEEILTLGIPTFNRREALVRVIQSAAGCAPIIVVDDGSQDGTRDAVRELDGVRLVSHDVNQGYAVAFMTLFAECSTEYLLVSADDDFFVPDAIRDLRDFLRRTRPAFVSTTWVDGGSGTTRGNNNRRIQPAEFLKASKHAPGLTYHVPSVRAALSVLSAAVESGEDAARVYPQVVILAALLADGADCQWSEIAPVAEGLQEPSGIRTNSGDTYSTFASQMQFRSSFARILDSMSGAEELRRANLLKLIVQVRRAVPAEIRSEFEDAYRRRLVSKHRKRLRRKLFRVLRRLIGR